LASRLAAAFVSSPPLALCPAQWRSTVWRVVVGVWASAALSRAAGNVDVRRALAMQPERAQ
jgi:hypothetical protein